MNCFCHPPFEYSLCLAGFKGKPPLTPAAPQALGPEALAEKTFVVKVPFTQDFLHTPEMKKRPLDDFSSSGQ